jgi:hypothetical protein
MFEPFKRSRLPLRSDKKRTGRQLVTARPDLASIQELTPIALKISPIVVQLAPIPADFAAVIAALLPITGNLLRRRASAKIAPQLTFVVEKLLAILLKLCSVIVNFPSIVPQFTPRGSPPPAPPAIVVSVRRRCRHH